MKFHVLISAIVNGGSNDGYIFEQDIEASHVEEIKTIMNQYQTDIDDGKIPSYSKHYDAGDKIQVEYSILEESEYRMLMRKYAEGPVSLDVEKAAEFSTWYENIMYNENKHTYVLINLYCDYLDLSHNVNFVVTLKGTKEEIERTLQSFKHDVNNISAYSLYQGVTCDWKILTFYEYSIFVAARNIQKDFFDDHSEYFYDWLNEYEEESEEEDE